MGSRDPRVDAYIARSADFARPILEHIRKLVHANCPDVVETMKWSFPHFDYRDSIFCCCAAFKRHCAFGFWLGDLLKIDTKAEKAMGQFGRIASVADLPSDREFARLCKEAMKLHDAGAKPPSRVKAKREAKPLEVPAAFAAALEKNRKARVTFEGFSPSHRKEYVEWYREAKTDATRQKRLAQAIEWMAQGKKRNWKYENC